MLRRKFVYLFKEYFSFTHSERIGIFVLMALIVCSIVLRIILSNAARQRSQHIPVAIANTTDIKNQVTEERIQNRKSGYKKNTSHYAKPGIGMHTIEMNTCDTLQLKELPGIGPVLSKRIIKYRDLLGGYYSNIQLMEVFGMTAEIFKKCKPYLVADVSKIRKLDINNASFKEINAHPYISYDQTKVIFTTRRRLNHIAYENFTQCGAFDSTQIQKVLPYLKFN